MKKLLLLVVAVSICAGAFSQAKKPTTTAAKPKPAGTATVPPGMKNRVDSFSYAVGLSIASNFKQQGIKDINPQMLLKAINDSKNGKLVMSENDAQMCIMNHMQAISSEKASGNKKAGETFLQQNKQKPGVVTLPSGLQYTVLTEGTGEKPTLTDQVKAHYSGSFIDGNVFESSYNSGQPLTIGVNRVIRGWTEALQLMPAGSKWRLFIPSDLAYGDSGSGSIPPGATLIFDVELLEVIKQ